MGECSKESAPPGGGAPDEGAGQLLDFLLLLLREVRMAGMLARIPPGLLAHAAKAAFEAARPKAKIFGGQNVGIQLVGLLVRKLPHR